jgi:hypothetical protein
MAAKLVKYEGNLKQLNMLLMQSATEKSALSRENMKLKEKVDKKRDKMQYTQKQLELTIRQFEQLRRENSDLIKMIAAQTQVKSGPSVFNPVDSSFVLQMN